jgi:hypothetical protein
MSCRVSVFSLSFMIAGVLLIVPRPAAAFKLPPLSAEFGGNIINEKTLGMHPGWFTGVGVEIAPGITMQYRFGNWSKMTEVDDYNSAPVNKRELLYRSQIHSGAIITSAPLFSRFFFRGSVSFGMRRMFVEIQDGGSDTIMQSDFTPLPLDEDSTPLMTASAGISYAVFQWCALFVEGGYQHSTFDGPQNKLDTGGVTLSAGVTLTLGGGWRRIGDGY